MSRDGPGRRWSPLSDLLGTLVSGRGRVAAAGTLGVDYGTVARCQQARQVSRRMRQVLREFRDSGVVGDDGPAVVVGDGEGADTEETPGERAAALEEENRALRETAEAQAKELEALRHRVAELEERVPKADGADVVDCGHGQPGDCRPPRRGHGLPSTGVAMLEEQPDEEHAFGPAAPLVAEWRRLRMAGQGSGSRVDREVVAVRRWGQEVEMLREFRLTLPPETEPLDDAIREDHIRWREEALAEARRALSREKRGRLLRRVVTLGLRWD